MNEESAWGSDTYHCATCGIDMDRDVLIFLSHTDQHIIDAIKEMHPGWVESDGACPR